MWRKNKYKNVRTDENDKNNDGYTFSSKGEARCYQLLKLMVKAGEIKILRCQDHVRLVLNPDDSRLDWKCIPDFKIQNLKSGEIEWVEFKGFETNRWKRTKSLWKIIGPGKLHIYKENKWGVLLVETIDPKKESK